jgi:hypothetical protein
MRATPATEKYFCEKLLRRFGLPTMGASGFMEAIGRMIDGHEHFRDLLTGCEPDQRHEMYESLRPYLRFEPKPLDVYLSEAGAIAESQQLPTWDDENKKFVPFHPPVIEGPEGQVIEVVNTTIEEITAKGHLTLVCRKCTKTASFPGERIADAIQKARHAGWTYNELKGDGQEICPDCP